MFITDKINTIIDTDETPGYKEFVEKFKPKKTTDDCYTPPLVYDAALGYAMERYGFQRDQVIRPFWPGTDYQTVDYPADCYVVDNPPFSIITSIVRWYMARGIRFFLFAPYLTNLNSNVDGVCHIIAPHSVTFENGAIVAVSFVTNLEPGILARSDPHLLKLISDADAANLKMAGRSALPKYAYPDNVLTATMLGYMASHDTAFMVRNEDGYFVRALDSQRQQHKSIFGAGYLLSDKAAAEKAAAEKAAAEKAAAEKAAAIVWTLSARERKIIDSLG